MYKMLVSFADSYCALTRRAKPWSPSGPAALLLCHFPNLYISSYSSFTCLHVSRCRRRACAPDRDRLTAATAGSWLHGGDGHGCGLCHGWTGRCIDWSAASDLNPRPVERIRAVNAANAYSAPGCRCGPYSTVRQTDTLLLTDGHIIGIRWLSHPLA